MVVAKARFFFFCLLASVTIMQAYNPKRETWQLSHYIWNFGIISTCDKGIMRNPEAYFATIPSFDKGAYQDLHAGDIVWMKALFVPQFCKQILPKLNVPIVLVIADGDESFPSDCGKNFDVEEFLNHPFIIHVFAQNNAYAGSSSKVSHIPIGMDFHTIAYKGKEGGWGERGSPQEQEAHLATILSRLKPTHLRKKRAFVDFHLSDSMHGGHQRYLQFGEDRKSIFQRLLKTGLIDYDGVDQIATREKPKIIICGATAYSRIIDFKKFTKIAKKVGAYLVADVSHIAGLIIGGVHPSPFPHADAVMTTTHKTLNGPRGAIIICRKKLAEKVDKAVFPGLQGGPHENQIAAKAVCFGEALRPEFKKYSTQIVRNAKTLARELSKNKLKLISGGTDNHLILIDVTSVGLDVKRAEKRFEEVGIVVNKNTIPGDKLPPTVGSGIRLGTPAITSRGMKEKEMRIIGQLVFDVLTNPKNIDRVKKEVGKLTKKFCVPSLG